MRLPWRKSPSQEMLAAGSKLLDSWVTGIERGEERRAAGLPPEPLSAEALAYAEQVSRRSFWALYEDDREDFKKRIAKALAADDA